MYSASTSKAKSLGFTAKDILRKGNWSGESTWKRFYNKGIRSKKQIFQESVLQTGTLWTEARIRQISIIIYKKVGSECKFVERFYEVKLRNFLRARSDFTFPPSLTQDIFTKWIAYWLLRYIQKKRWDKYPKLEKPPLKGEYKQIEAYYQKYITKNILLKVE